MILGSSWDQAPFAMKTYCGNDVFQMTGFQLHISTGGFGNAETMFATGFMKGTLPLLPDIPGLDTTFGNQVLTRRSETKFLVLGSAVSLCIRSVFIQQKLLIQNVHKVPG